MFVSFWVFRAESFILSVSFLFGFVILRFSLYVILMSVILIIVILINITTIRVIPVMVIPMGVNPMMVIFELY